MPSRPATGNGHQHHRPPNYYYSASSQPPSSSPSIRGCCCCCLFLLLSFLALLLPVAFLVIVLAVKPQKPQFDLLQVSIQHVWISSNPAASIDVVKAKLVKGVLPGDQPIVVKAKLVSKIAKKKIKESGGSVILTA